MTEQGLFDLRSVILVALRGIVSKNEAEQMMVSLQLGLAKFMLSEASKVASCNAVREAYIGSPEYGLCCLLIERLDRMAHGVSFEMWYEMEHRDPNADFID